MLDGAAQVTTMSVLRLAVAGALGVSGLIACRMLKRAEGSEKPTEFSALTWIS